MNRQSPLRVIPGKDYPLTDFSPSSRVYDFPIRDRKVVLHIRRRRWVEKATGKSFSRSWELTAEGTHYTVGFAAFLKEVFGYAPNADKQS